MKTGFLMNILCVLVLTLGVNTWGYAYFNLGSLPTWANNYNATDSIALHNMTTVSPYQLVTWGNTSHNNYRNNADYSKTLYFCESNFSANSWYFWLGFPLGLNISLHFKFWKSDHFWGSYSHLKMPMMPLTPIDIPPSEFVRKIMLMNIWCFTVLQAI